MNFKDKRDMDGAFKGERGIITENTSSQNNLMSMEDEDD
jgi:hypothetical protein